MAEMRLGWLVGFEDGQYVVYTRHDSSEYSTGYETGEEIGRSVVLADALDLADRWARNEALAKARREQEHKERLAAMSSDERAEYEARISRYRQVLDLTFSALPMSKPPFITNDAAADGQKIHWRSLVMEV